MKKENEEQIDQPKVYAFLNKLLNKLKALFPQGNFARSVTLLAGGTAFGQAVNVLASPLMTRLYTPESFGVFAFFSSILSILTVLAALRYEMAIPLAEDDTTAVNLLALSLAIVVGISLLTAVVITFMGSIVIKRANVPLLSPYLWLLPLAVLVVGSYQVFYYWASRKRLFKAISATKVLQAFAQVTIQGVGGLLPFHAFGLIIGYITGQFAGIGLLWRKAEFPLRSIHPKQWVHVARIHKNFPLYTLWASLINVLGLQAPLLLMASYFSLETVGYFSLSMRVLGLPAVLVGQAVGQVFYPRMADFRENQASVKVFVERLATTLSFISFPVFALIVLIGPELFVFFFGVHWQTAGEYAQYLAPWLAIAFVSSPLSLYAIVKGKQRQAFWITFYETALRLGAVYIGCKQSSPKLALYLYSGVGFIICLAYFSWILHLSGTSLLSWIAKIKAFLIAGIVITSFLFTIKPLCSTHVRLVLNTVVLASFAIYFIYGTMRERGDA